MTTAPGTRPATRLVSLAEVRDAAARLRGVALRTPLLPFGRPLDGDPRGRTRAWLKAESLQPIGAFKIRGAYNAMAQLGPDELARGVVAHSSGNHAQGVARAARLLGTRAVVVMPGDAAAVKIAAVRADGARIEFVRSANEERIARAHELAASEGLTLIPAYDDPRIVAGQGTTGLEVIEQLAEVGLDGPPTVLVPIGGGGLASGVAVAVKGLAPGARVFGVEPELAADARDSLASGHVVRWDPALTGRTAADGMRASAVGELTFAHLAALLDGVVVVSESEIARATLRAAREARLIVEPSGATAIAAWAFHAAELPADGPVAIVVSGGNVDRAIHAALLVAGEAAGG